MGTNIDRIYVILFKSPISRGTSPNVRRCVCLEIFVVAFVLPLTVAILAELFGYWLNRKDK